MFGNGSHPPGRVILIRPSALGDVCRTVPALVSLRQAWPEARIDWLIQDQFAAAVEAHPALDEAVLFPRQRFGRLGRSIEVSGEFMRWLRDLRGRSYDVAIDLQGLARSGFFAWMTGAPVRVGFANAREGAAIAYTHRRRVDDHLHTVDRMLSLLESQGVSPVRDMRLYTSEADRSWWSERRLELGVERGRIYAVMAPTARWASKRWPAERFASLIGPLRERGVDRVVLIGAAGEREQCEPLLDSAHDGGVVDLVGATSVGQLMAVVEQCELMIANDSAALHMAVGFDRRFVALFGPTDIGRVGPYRGACWVVQKVRPDEQLHHKDPALGASIMERIGVDDVLRMIDTVFSDRPLASGS